MIFVGSQYKDASHLISLQQNENSAMWLHGPGSRTVSAVPASTYYNFQGQNQQPGGFRQAAKLEGWVPWWFSRPAFKSRLNSYGKTATKSHHFPLFQGHVVSFESGQSKAFLPSND
ncbi:hypothetical protein OIU77_009160 [Salix suchowensis]|uniref:Uncharacterized protein n=1 Tax=Salix suchowensis TaxID=1278906 RepID=A0ABQ9ADN6_9ROSI|nr:hypothetical protein OIU77_009160 [Salix suchowensis]